jgi:hypothetical protein
LRGDEALQSTVTFLHFSPLTFPTFNEIESLLLDIGAVSLGLIKEFLHRLITLLVDFFSFVQMTVVTMPITSN